MVNLQPPKESTYGKTVFRIVKRRSNLTRYYDWLEDNKELFSVPLVVQLIYRDDSVFILDVWADPQDEATLKILGWHGNKRPI